MLPILSVTGTKGKTSVVRALDHVLMPTVDYLLRVDTEGAWVNGQHELTHDDSKLIWGLAPANAPGRFITLLAKKAGKRCAVLEANLFCSKACGLGYSTHKVGVFTNVFEDHKGADTTLQTKEDIASAKSFIFSRIGNEGYAVYNADDSLITAQLKRLPSKKLVTKIACSLNEVKTGDINLYVNEAGEIVCNGSKTKYDLGQVADYKMYKPGFEPSAYNVLLVIGALIGYFDDKVPEAVIDSLKAYEPTEESGRLVTFKTEDGRYVIFDFAHEKESLKEITKLAKHLSPKGKIIGVLRLSPTRTDDLVTETAKAIANDFDTFVIYDKIDGKTRLPSDKHNPFRQEKVGYVSKLFADMLKAETKSDVFHIIEEEAALKKAASLARPEDVIIYVQGNNPKISLQLLYKTFNNKLQRI